MVSFLSGVLQKAGNLTWSRLADAPRIHVEASSFVGDIREPGVRLVVNVEETSRKGSHIANFRVEVTEPLKTNASRIEVREKALESKPIPLPISLPAGGAIGLRIIALLPESLPSPQGEIKGRVTAVGAKGYREKWTGFSTSYGSNA